MSEGTKIQWCDDTHNFWRGCVKVSPGCVNCYAEVSTPVRVARSEGRELWGGTLRDRAKDFDAPLRWNEKPWICDGCGKAHPHGHLAAYGERQICDGCGWREATFHRRRVFSLSLGDWLDDAVPIEWLADMLDVIRRCPNLDFLLLTKRPENWLERIELAVLACNDKDTDALCAWLHHWIFSGCDNAKLRAKYAPPRNVWIGTTVENQEYADKRIPELLKIPAACRFISYEPALGPVDVSTWLPNQEADQDTTAFHNFHHPEDSMRWIIVGGESGPKARPFNIEWARSTVEQCKTAGVACFVKQLGAEPFYQPHADGAHGPIYWMRESDIEGAGVIKDKKGGDMSEWPEDLRVRQFPEISQSAIRDPQ